MSDEDEVRRPGHMYDPAAPLPEHLMPKPELPPRRGRLRDVDSAEVGFRVRAGALALWGLIPGALLGAVTGAGIGAPPLIGAVIGAVMAWALIYFGSLFLAEKTARAGSSIYFSAGSIPVARQYSLAESLAVRGRLEEAVAEYERNAAEFATDPEPALRLARLLRDRMARPEEAIEWFRTALRRTEGNTALEIATTREIIEICTHRLHSPTRALPYLARLAAGHPGTTVGEWARIELSEIKRSVRVHEDEPRPADPRT